MADTPKPDYPIPIDPDVTEWAASLDQDGLEFFNERAGIREFDGGLSRLEAEFEARKDVERWLRGKT